MASIWVRSAAARLFAHAARGYAGPSVRIVRVRDIERVTRPHEDQGNEAHDLRDSLADTHSSSLLRVRFAGQKLISMKPVNVRKLGYENPSNRNEYGSPDSPATSGSYPEYLVKVKRLRPITPIRRLLTPQPSFSSVPWPMV